MTLDLIPLRDCPEATNTVLEWTLSLWGDHIPGYSRQNWIDFYRHGASANFDRWEGQGQELIFIGNRGDKVVGAISLVDFDDLEEFRQLTPWVAAFIVNPDLRGQGIGSEMLVLLEKRAKGLGLDVLHLWTEDQSIFYEKRGYERIAKGNLEHLTFDVLKKSLV